MFNKKLKKEIQILSDRVDVLFNSLGGQQKKIARLKYQIENPPKFKKGEKIGSVDISSIKLQENSFSFIETLWGLKIFLLKDKCPYSYTVKHKGFPVVTSEITEDQLTEWAKIKK